MSATRAFGVEGMNGAIPECCQRMLQKTAFIQRVCMDGYLDIHLVGDIQAVVDCRWCAAPVFVKFQANRTGAYLFLQR